MPDEGVDRYDLGTATTMTTVPGADHYLWDSIPSVTDGVVAWVTAQLPG